MKKTILATAVLAISATALTPVTAQEATEIHFWHAMSGVLGERLDDIVAQFNESQDDYDLIATYKGNYTALFNAVVAAYRAGEQPHIFQNNESGYTTLLLSGSIKPAGELLKENGVEVSLGDYLAPVVETYTTTEGELFGMPFNSSTPLMYYNADILSQAGFGSAPQTWEEMEEMTRTIKEQGLAGCGYAFNAGQWEDIENFSSIHGQPYATNANGREGYDTELLFNQGLVVDHMENMNRWIDEGLAFYGRDAMDTWASDARQAFLNQDCMFFAASSAAGVNIREGADFDVQAYYLPHYEGVEPRNSTIGGAALYVLQGHEPEDYAGVADFFELLTSSEIQKWWHQETGYVPVTNAAYEELKQEGYYEENPSQEYAVLQLRRTKPNETGKVSRLGNFGEIRDIIREELERVWLGEAEVQEALDSAASRGNEVLERFARQNNQ